MKQFSNYQYVEGEPMSSRDRQEIGSKFWNKGKWDNFVLPFLPDDCKDMTLIDIGCNAGLFLKLAEDKGFSRVIGVDANKEAFNKALAYKDRNGGKYKLQRRTIQRCSKHLPMADYTVLANAHYYLTINDWLEYLDKLQTKTRYCIIVTAAKDKYSKFKASPHIVDIKRYFKGWEEVGFTGDISTKGDPFPRNLWGICFKSKLFDRTPINVLIHDNTLLIDFWKELDEGINSIETGYCKKLTTYRRGSWSVEKVHRFIIEKSIMYKNVKEEGLMKPIIIDDKNNILDGIHRTEMMKHLGHKSIITRTA